AGTCWPFPCGAQALHNPNKPMEQLTLRERVAIAKRSPRRITITVSHAVSERLVNASVEQGRSISNLCAYLLESVVPGGR
ncbi:MAG: ribbon-helix-helix domain-containing protein, partial [Vulcanococcus sp.]